MKNKLNLYNCFFFTSFSFLYFSFLFSLAFLFFTFAALEQIRINRLNEFPGRVEQLNRKDFNLARFCLETWPRTEISLNNYEL